MIALSIECQYIKTNNSIKTGCVVTLKPICSNLSRIIKTKLSPNTVIVCFLIRLYCIILFKTPPNKDSLFYEKRMVYFFNSSKVISVAKALCVFSTTLSVASVKVADCLMFNEDVPTNTL